MTMSTRERCCALRERHYPVETWPGVLYEGAVTGWKDSMHGWEPGRVLVEIGCGREAKRLRRMAQSFDQGVGIDLEIAPSASWGRTRLVHGDAHRIAMATDSADVIAMANVVEHLCDPAVAFAECARVLRPGGRLVVMTVNKWFLPIVLGRALPHRARQLVNGIVSGTRSEDTFRTYYRANTSRELARHAFFAGLSAVSVRYIPQHPQYLMFWAKAYRAGIAVERLTRPIRKSRHMILAIFEKAGGHRAQARGPGTGAPEQVLGEAGQPDEKRPGMSEVVEAVH